MRLAAAAVPVPAGVDVLEVLVLAEVFAPAGVIVSADIDDSEPMPKGASVEGSLVSATESVACFEDPVESFFSVEPETPELADATFDFEGCGDFELVSVVSIPEIEGHR